MAGRLRALGLAALRGLGLRPDPPGAGVGLPIAGHLFGFDTPAMPWRDLAVFVGVILGLGAARSLEKILGASE